MNVNFESLLHPRVLSHCRQLYVDGHYKHAALEAMTQVELALKEKSGVKDRFGVSLVTNLFADGKGIKLRVPFGNEMQGQAETLFKGAFAYYRNYCAHDGNKVDGRTCLRIMVLASELLDLIGASQLSFADVGGAAGLVKVGIFPDKDGVANLLCILDVGSLGFRGVTVQFAAFCRHILGKITAEWPDMASNKCSPRKVPKTLDGFTLPDDDPGRLDDDLLESGYTLTQVNALIDTGLVEYVSQEYIVPVELLDVADTLPSTVGWFQLTELGKRIAGSE